MATPITGVHTNTIEGTLNGMKTYICRQHFNREFIDGALMEFIWRRRYAGETDCYMQCSILSMMLELKIMRM